VTAHVRRQLAATQPEINCSSSSSSCLEGQACAGRLAPLMWHMQRQRDMRRHPEKTPQQQQQQQCREGSCSHRMLAHWS
jgi:hypothetical protein